MGPRKSFSDGSNESGFPAVLYKFCKEEDVLIIPQFVTHLGDRQVERASPKKSKDSKLGERFGSNSVFGNETKVDDLLICGSLRPPQVGIAYENPDDKETPLAIMCKNIYMEFSLISAIGKSLKPYPTISCLKIENCCISKEIAEALAGLLAEEPGRWVSDLSLDGNEDLSEVLPLFIRLPIGVRYLSLERCSLDDDAIKSLAEPLGFTDEKEHRLQLLSLSMNRIGDAGVFYLAKALRTNRSLISLSLAGNQISDVGIGHLGEVLQKFRLTYEEVVLRRKRTFDTIFRKKNAVEKYLEEWKMRGGVENLNVKTSAKNGGRKIRGPDGKVRCLSSRDRKIKPATAKMNSGEKFRGKTRAGGDEGLVGAEPTPSEIVALVQQVESEMPPDKHPFVNEVLSGAEDGFWCPGCWSLENINLAYNYISEKSLEKFSEVFYSQSENFPPKIGLVRLVLLPGNLFQENVAEFQKLQNAVIYRNFKKGGTENADLLPSGSLSSFKKMNSTGKRNKVFEHSGTLM